MRDSVMILPSARSRELGLSVSVDEAHEGVEVVDGPAAPPAGESTTKSDPDCKVYGLIPLMAT